MSNPNEQAGDLSGVQFLDLDLLGQKARPTGGEKAPVGRETAEGPARRRLWFLLPAGSWRPGQLMPPDFRVVKVQVQEPEHNPEGEDHRAGGAVVVESAEFAPVREGNPIPFRVLPGYWEPFDADRAVPRPRYTTATTIRGECLPDGFLPVSSCRCGAQVGILDREDFQRIGLVVAEFWKVHQACVARPNLDGAPLPLSAERALWVWPSRFRKDVTEWQVREGEEVREFGTLDHREVVLECDILARIAVARGCERVAVDCFGVGLAYRERLGELLAALPSGRRYAEEMPREWWGRYPSREGERRPVAAEGQAVDLAGFIREVEGSLPVPTPADGPAPLRWEPRIEAAYGAGRMPESFLGVPIEWQELAEDLSAAKSDPQVSAAQVLDGDPEGGQ